MDETVVNGAQSFYSTQFGLIQSGVPNASENQWLLGLVNSAPYVSTRNDATRRASLDVD